MCVISIPPESSGTSKRNIVFTRVSQTGCRILWHLSVLGCILRKAWRRLVWLFQKQKLDGTWFMIIFLDPTHVKTDIYKYFVGFKHVSHFSDEPRISLHQLYNICFVRCPFRLTCQTCTTLKLYNNAYFQTEPARKVTDCFWKNSISGTTLAENHGFKRNKIWNKSGTSTQYPLIWRIHLIGAPLLFLMLAGSPRWVYPLWFT